VDFVPVKSSYQTIKDFLENKLLENDYFLDQILVIPAFEVFLTTFNMPLEKNEFIALWDNNTVEQFHLNFFIFGHRPTNYSFWKTALTPYRSENDLLKNLVVSKCSPKEFSISKLSKLTFSYICRFADHSIY